jgi:hypothetical protein
VGIFFFWQTEFYGFKGNGGNGRRAEDTESYLSGAWTEGDA